MDQEFCSAASLLLSTFSRLRAKYSLMPYYSVSGGIGGIPDSSFEIGGGVCEKIDFNPSISPA